MARLFVNFVRSQLEQTLLAAGTTLFIDTADAALLPAFAPGDLLRGTLSDGIQPPELIDVTAVSGGTLTVVRALETTAAQEWPGGTRLTFGTTAELLGNALNAAQSKFRWTGTATGTDAYTLTVTGILPVPTDGDEISFLIPNTNTGNVTVTVSNGVDPSIGPFSARNTDGAEFGAGSFAAGFYVSLRWVASVGRWIASNLASSRLPATAINDGPLTDANVVPNGDLDQWNFGTSFNTPASGTVTADNHFPTYDGTIGTFSISRQAHTPGQTEVGGDPLWFLRWDHTVAGSGSTVRQLHNRLRAHNGVAWRNGETVTYSVYLKADSARTVNIILRQNFGTGGAPSADVGVVTQPCSVTTAWQRFSVTATLTSVAGKTFGTNDDHQLVTILSFPINTTMTIDVAMEQLEAGPRVSEPWGSYPIPLQLGGTGRVASSDASLASQLGSAILADLLTRDGAGSGLDADLLDGLTSTDFVRATGSVAETVTGNKTFSAETLFSNATAMRLIAAAGTNRTIFFQSGAGAAGQRWGITVNNVAESGSDVGSDFTIGRYNDAGTFQEIVVAIQRSSGIVTYSDAQRGPAGSAANPTWSFSTDIDSGMFSAGADSVGLATGGVVRLTLSNASLTSTLPLLGAAGTEAAPSLSFSGDSNTGLFSQAADVLGITVGGTERARVTAGQFLTVDGTAGAPAGSFTSDTDTGRYRIGANNIGWSLGGTLRFDANTARLLFAAAYDIVLNVPLSPTDVGSVGYRGAPTQTQNAAYEFVLGDSGRTILHDETSARTWTIPANASVAFPIGTVIILDNTGNAAGAPGTLTIAITSDTLRRGDGTAGTGSRTVGSNAVAMVRKTKATEWVITGVFT